MIYCEPHKQVVEKVLMASAKSCFVLCSLFNMAFATASQTSYSLLFGSRENINGRRRRRRRAGFNSSHVNINFKVYALSQQQGPGNQQRKKAPPGVDTRIHWENEDDGWIGGNTSSSSSSIPDDQEQQKNFLGEKFSDLLNLSSDSHYQFLGISAAADLEEIKAAYRRLSKEYHPDTTSLPLKDASDRFLRLREIYDVLSNEESRRFYDWTLAQEAASRQAEKMRMKLEDPYEQELENYKPVPDMVDRLGGRNMELSDQAYTALTIDAVIIVFAIACTIYVTFFKEY